MKNSNTYKATIQRIINSSVLVFATLMVVLSSGYSGESELFAQPRQEEDFFYSDDKEVPVIVYLDSLGVLVKEGVSADQLTQIIAPLRLRIVRALTENIFILSVTDTLTRSDLVKLAREVKRRGAELIAQTGLIVRPITTEVPFVASDEFIAQFFPNVKREQIDKLNSENSVEIVMQNPFVPNQYLLRVTEASQLDALKMANRYHENELTEFAHPDFIRVVVRREFIPNDPLFPNQWHLHNTGQSGGTVDADIDAPLAWDITRGNANVVIAVIDNGFDMTHPDLTPNLWVNPGEIPGNGIDDDNFDGNPSTFIDDVNGWDFTGCTPCPPPPAIPPPGCGLVCGDNNPAPRPSTFDGNPNNDNDHGTAVAGVAVARGHNAIGVTGSAPNCRFMPIRQGSTFFADGLAFGYAQQMGPQIITNSWGYAIGTPITTNVSTAINNAATVGRGGLGCVIFFAMNNGNVNDCGATPDISSLPNVIAVSGSTNQDRKVVMSAFGNCMDIVSPTHRGYRVTDPYTGTLNITTTDRQGTAGYNNNNSICTVGLAETADNNYTNCFGGTSSATPLAAGIAGLILTANPGLTRVQVQRLLQDTADKIEDSAGRYADNTGFSSPATGQATHGWGRVNAFEAARIAAPVANGGKAGIDIFLRDNRLDWGNTEQPSNLTFESTRGFIAHWRSMDIKVDAPPYQPVPTAATFDAFTDETPSGIAGEVNKVYVRVRNRGPATASSVTVKLHWTQFGTALPALPSDFWSAFPANSTNTSQWHPLNCSGTTSSICTVTNLAYSGSSEAGCPGRAQPSCGWDLNGDGDTTDPGETPTDAAQIASFDFPAPPVDPTMPNHFCLLAMIDSPQDRVLPKSRPTVPSDFVVDQLTPTDNNVTHRNYFNLPTSRATRFDERFFVRNPIDERIQAVLRLVAPQDWKISLDRLGFDQPFILEPKQEILVTMNVNLPELNLNGDVTIMQEQTNPPKVMGGLTLQFRAPERAPTFPPAGGVLSPYLVGTFDLREGANTILHIVNPTAKTLRIIVAFFDDNEKPLACYRDRLTPNDLVEINVRQHVPENQFGVVKVVSFHQQEDLPEVGIVGYQKNLYPRRFLFFSKGPEITETVLHSIPNEILSDDLKYIRQICQ